MLHSLIFPYHLCRAQIIKVSVTVKVGVVKRDLVVMQADDVTSSQFHYQMVSSLALSLSSLLPSLTECVLCDPIVQV